MGELVREGARHREISALVAGCGRMGLPMGRALVESGVRTRGFDIRRNDAFPGLPMEFEPATAMAGTTHLLSVVRDVPQTEALLFEDQALLAHCAGLDWLIVCSTLPPGYIHDLRQRLPDHIRLTDAPMSGAAIAAIERRLTFMIGGTNAEFEELSLLLSTMGEQFHHTGPLGTGMLAKVLNNMVAAASTATTRAALDLAEVNGLSAEALLRVMHDSSGQTWFGTGFDRIEFARDGYAEDNSIGLLVKDLACAATCAPGGTHPLAQALSQSLRGLRDRNDD